MPARFDATEDGLVLLDADATRPDLPLVIDPGLEWASFLGGSKDERTRTMDVAPGGDPVVGGHTFSSNFPTTPGVVDQENPTLTDAFVTLFTSDGSDLVFSTFLGAGSSDEVTTLQILPTGESILCGYTYSLGFPVVGEVLDGSINGGADGFVARLSADGSTLVFSTFLGGSLDDFAQEIQVDSSGDFVVAGETDSTDLPQSGPVYQFASGGAQDLFIARISSNGEQLHWLTYLGGIGTEELEDLRLGVDGGAVVLGRSDSPSFPTTPGAFDTVKDVPPLFPTTFITKLTQGGDALDFSTFLEGSSKAAFGLGLDVNSSGLIAVVGDTAADDFPVTPGAFDTRLDFSAEPFATVLTADGSALVYSTYLNISGGSGTDAVSAVLGDSGGMTVFGTTSGLTFPATPGAFDSVNGSAWDVFALRIKPDGSDLLYATLLGNESGFEQLADGGLDANGDAFLVGTVGSQNFPVTEGAYDVTWGGGGPQGWGDAFVAKMELQPSGVTSFGNPSPSCLGDIRLTALSNPVAGDSGFTVACVGAPPDSFGFLILDFLPYTPGLSVFGIEFFVDLTQPLFLFAAASDSFGQSETTIPLPATSAGISFYLQHTWFNTAACGGAGTFSASDALQVAIGS